jgi:hypothetical protein
VEKSPLLECTLCFFLFILSLSLSLFLPFIFSPLPFPPTLLFLFLFLSLPPPPRFPSPSVSFSHSAHPYLFSPHLTAKKPRAPHHAQDLGVDILLASNGYVWIAPTKAGMDRNQIFVRTYIHECIYLSISISISIYTYIDIDMYIYLSIYLSIYLYIYKSKCFLRRDAAERLITMNHHARIRACKSRAHQF